MPTMSKDMHEQLQVAHKVVDAVHRVNRKTCVTLLTYNVDKSEISCAQVRLLARKEKKDEKFQHKAHVEYKLDEFIDRIDVLNSVSDKIVTNQPVYNVT